MIRPLLDLLYGSIPVEWESSYGLEESVARLRAATKKSAFSVLAESAAVGTVTPSKVKLQRVIPMVANSYKPFLIGQFVMRGERVFLIGRFTMLGVVKTFMSIWFGGSVIFAFAAVARMPFQPSLKSGTFGIVLGAIAMCAFGVGLPVFGKWLARNDTGWLEDVVQRAIGNANPVLASSAETALSGTASRGRPTVATVTAGVLAIMGAMNLAVAIVGPSSIGGDPFRFMAMHSSAALRCAVAGQGVLLLATAVGIYMRLSLAWRAGFLLIANALAFAVASAFLADPKMVPPLGMRIVAATLGLLVTIQWVRWWNAQRIHFVSA
jgi:hypothetical protein